MNTSYKSYLRRIVFSIVESEYASALFSASQLFRSLLRGMLFGPVSEKDINCYDASDGCVADTS